MSIFIGHTSAAAAWRYAMRWPAGAPALSRVRRMGEAPPSRDLVRRARGLLPEAGERLEALVPSARWRRKWSEARFAVWGAPVPAGAFLRLDEGVFVSSPEFCFLQMASRLPLVQLIWLGCELCAAYAVNPADPADLPGREPPTTRARIIRFLDKAAGAPGVVRARRAARYIVDGAASPMEVAAALLLCLPCALGGCGLPRPQLNRRIDIGLQGAAVTGSRFFRCDLYWPEKRVALEYDSNDHHLRADESAADSARRNALAFLGVSVVTMTTRHLYSPSETDRVVRVLARHLSITLRPRVASYAARRHALRRVVLFERDFLRGFC